MTNRRDCARIVAYANSVGRFGSLFAFARFFVNLEARYPGQCDASATPTAKRDLPCRGGKSVGRCPNRKDFENDSSLAQRTLAAIGSGAIGQCNCLDRARAEPDLSQCVGKFWQWYRAVQYTDFCGGRPHRQRL